MGFLTAIVGVEDAAGNRVDLPAADGTRRPIVLRLSDNFDTTAVDSGGFKVITLDVDALTNSTHLATGGTLVRRDGSAGALFGYIGVGSGTVATSGDIRSAGVNFILRGRRGDDGANLDIINKTGNDFAWGGGLGNSSEDVGTGGYWRVRVNFNERVRADEYSAGNGRVLLSGDGKFESAGHGIIDCGSGATLFLRAGGTTNIRVLASQLGFFGASAVSRPAAYTQTYATTTRTHAAYTADNESAAYTGAADGEAKLADLNALRVAYENLRAAYESTSALLNQVLDDIQLLGLLQ